MILRSTPPAFSDREFGDLLSNFGDAPFLHNSKVAIPLTRPSVAA
jgi:hypothetical protein